MAWIESHQSIRQHPKLIDFAAALEIEPVHACGHLHFLWYSVLDYAQDGDVTRFSAPVVAGWAGWARDPKTFFDALMGTGWLDTDGNGAVTVHDWWDYAGKLVAIRIKDAERKKEWRRVQRTSGGRRTESARSPYVDPRPTNQEVPTEEGEKTTSSPPASAHAESGRGPKMAKQSPISKEGQAFLDFFSRTAGIDLVSCKPRDFMIAWRARKKRESVREIQDKVIAWSKSDQWKKNGGQYRAGVITFLTGDRYFKMPTDQQKGSLADMDYSKGFDDV